jgi:DNA-binding phage protein
VNINSLKAEIARNGLTIPTLAEKVGMNKKTLYGKIKGVSSFTISEVSKIVDALNLTDEAMLEIFFDKQ